MLMIPFNTSCHLEIKQIFPLEGEKTILSQTLCTTECSLNHPCLPSEMAGLGTVKRRGVWGLGIQPGEEASFYCHIMNLKFMTKQRIIVMFNKWDAYFWFKFENLDIKTSSSVWLRTWVLWVTLHSSEKMTCNATMKCWTSQRPPSVGLPGLPWSLESHPALGQPHPHLHISTPTPPHTLQLYWKWGPSLQIKLPLYIYNKTFHLVFLKQLKYKVMVVFF